MAKKSTKTVSKYVANRQTPRAVKAQKILKSGKVSASAKSFASISEAATWAVKQGLTDKTQNAEFNICVAAQGYDRDTVRKSAYGYVWSRAQFLFIIGALPSEAFRFSFGDFMKKLLILISLVSCLFISCAEPVHKEDPVNSAIQFSESDFINLKKIAGRVYVDLNSDVLYYYDSRYSDRSAMSPIMEADGTCLTFSEWKDKQSLYIYQKCVHQVVFP